MTVWGLGLLAITASTLVANAIVGSDSGAQVRQETTATTYPPGPHGSDTSMHTESDTNFCLSDIAAEGRPTSIEQCAPNENLEWMWAQSADNSSVIVDSEGQCLQASSKSDKDAKVEPCTFQTPEHFLYKNDGQIETVSGSLCLEAAAASENAAVLFAKCDKKNTNQIWTLTR
jgi:hypothetical protein